MKVLVEDILCSHGKFAGRGHGTVTMEDLAWPFSKVVLLSSGLCPLALLAAGVLLELVSSFLVRLTGCAGTFTVISFLFPNPFVFEQQNRLRHISVKHMPPKKLKLKTTTDVCSMLKTEVEGWLAAVC